MADLSRPRRALCIILGLCAASFFIIEIWGKNTPSRHGQLTGDEGFTITQRFYGMDAEEMERIAAIPLEDTLAGIDGVKRIFSSCENGRVRVSARFEGRVKGRYEAVREAAQRVYESLPEAAQRPEISSAGDSRIPVWTAAAASTGGVSPGTALEKTVKPALERLPGAGEVEISGTGPGEILVILKAEEAAARNISAPDIAAVLASEDALFPAGSIRAAAGESLLNPRREIPLVVDGRYKSAEELQRVFIPLGGPNGERRSAFLGDLADVRPQERNYDSRSRLNGKETVLVAVMGSAGADLGKLSSLIKEELAKHRDLEFTVLSDRGEEERKARNSALGAALEGACAVALLSALISSRRGKNLYMALICTLTVPALSFFSAALLILLGKSLDKLVLAGLAAGAGAAVDTAILSAEYFGPCYTMDEGKKALEDLVFPLISGSVTTVIALVPLMVWESQGISSAAWAIASVNFAAMVFALTLLPPLFLWAAAGSPFRASKGILKTADRGGLFSKTKGPFRFKKKPSLPVGRMPYRCGRWYRRRLAFLARGIPQKPLPVIFCWCLFSLAGIAALFFGGADVEEEGSGNSLYAQIEFEGGLHVEECDRRLALYGEELKKHPGILSVQTLARTGTGSALAGFDQRIMERTKVRDLMRSIPVPGAFVYILEPDRKERNWRIRIAGDEGKRCEELAVEAARICAALPLVSETVLNFKEGGPRLELAADRERLASAGLSFNDAGETVRRYIHGPVAYKRMDRLGETDVRIRGNETMDKGDVLNIQVRPGLAMASLVSVREGRERASIQREDRRRGASLSIRTAVMDPRRVKDRVMRALKALELPPGYSVEFDPPAIKAARDVSGRALLFVLALFFCYLVIAAFTESFTFPLAVLAVVPPSLALPALWMVFGGIPLNGISAAAFVAVSGIAVNAAALWADALQHGEIAAFFCYRALRRRLPVLAATSGTTVAGAVPFLFVGESAAQVIKTLSMVSALGVAASALCAVTLIPALARIFPRILRPLELIPGRAG
ncbi:MAG: efflux RND transporter permease subunit [Treponema sp.]|nr:efflux RND transporter permease subunit [Treponema sp.]